MSTKTESAAHQITPAQLRALQGFYTHCYVAYHQGGTLDTQFWADELDKAQIPWTIQNTVSSIASERESMSLYLRTHLSNKGITIH